MSRNDRLVRKLERDFLLALKVTAAHCGNPSKQAMRPVTKRRRGAHRLTPLCATQPRQRRRNPAVQHLQHDGSLGSAR
jgi:hypothetical protein